MDARMITAKLANVALIVDDDPDSIRMVSTALEENGTTVLVARDGATALDLTQRVSPDVVLLDALMPGMDGFETCRRLKAPPIMTQAPIVFMTGLSDPEHVLAGLQAGGVDYVTKPVNVDELIARVTTHILNARLINSARSALDAEGVFVLAFSVDQTLTWSSPKALALLASSGLDLLPDGQPPAELKDWLARVVQQPVSSATSITLQGFRLDYLGQDPGGEILIRIARTGTRDEVAFLAERLALTVREAEVLLWLTQGKTNRDIGEILSLSGRTINKHLEQVFQKMGVDNRTSAALIADRALWSARD
ncbi:MAG: DNA-binding response regulator [Rhodobacteraceae bacterium]|nr:DNA-binding response regulator [Paracoccaceae bacterium]